MAQIHRIEAVPTPSFDKLTSTHHVHSAFIFALHECSDTLQCLFMCHFAISRKLRAADISKGPLIKLLVREKNELRRGGGGACWSVV